MYLPDFDYYAPATLKEACFNLARLDGDAKVLAGGTDLLPHMKNEVIAPKALVSLKEIQGMQEITYVPGRGVVIGAKATHNALVRSQVLRDRYPSISETAHSMANYQIRNRGTIGGNIVSAVPSADLPPILMALDASVVMAGPHGTRTIPLEQFFVGPRCSVIACDEILTDIVIPDQAATGSAYFKFGLRRSGALAVVGVAASIVVNETRVAQAHVVLGAVAPTPVRAFKAEQLLIGNSVTEALLEEVGRAAADECKPISDIRGSEEYRRDMVRVFTKRALRKALHLPGEQKRGVK
ncbi:MAG: xanthine dehydrogenase family protein subunit M [Syntrophorhabdaceae bacterium]|nr:xanthine dehydrogenase family protein subunit M [Syntrophorhabdaceae bacterium]MDD5242787.1 xanthine dehydrogenase family protein subunit M [Syntrophorhabdaceae bacterium]